MSNKDTFNEKMNDLADAINEKAGTTGAKNLDQLKTTVNSINTGSDVTPNPELDGTEAALTGIQVDETKYAIKTHLPFFNEWPTESTTDAFCAAIKDEVSAVAGMSYFGELSCTDLPDQELMNVDVVAEVIADNGHGGNKVIHLIATSGDTYPFRWEYTYWNNGLSRSGWIAFQTEIKPNPALSGDEEVLTGLQVGDTKYAVPTPTTVVANPTMAGTEGDLTGLQVGDTKYKVRDDFLPLSGGTVSGNIQFNSGTNAICDPQGNDIVRGASTIQIGTSQKSLNILSNNSDLTHNKAGVSTVIFDSGNTSANPTLVGDEHTLTGLEINYTKYKVPSGGSSVVPNPTLAGTEADLSGIEVDGTKYKIPTGTDVVANPTLAGTEVDLTGIQVGDTKYAIPSGGGASYQHNIVCGGPGNGTFYFSLITSDASAYTTSLEVVTHMTEGKPIMITGYYTNGFFADYVTRSGYYIDCHIVNSSGSTNSIFLGFTSDSVTPL